MTPPSPVPVSRREFSLTVVSVLTLVWLLQLVGYMNPSDAPRFRIFLFILTTLSVLAYAWQWSRSKS